jgi:hypothetical protein
MSESARTAAARDELQDERAAVYAERFIQALARYRDLVGLAVAQGDLATARKIRSQYCRLLGLPTGAISVEDLLAGPD